MYIDTNTIVAAASVITALTVIFSIIFAIYKWYLRQNQQDKEIKQVKDEQCMICYGLLACLNGLKQLGANGQVTEAHNRLEKHINKTAHDVE